MKIGRTTLASPEPACIQSTIDSWPERRTNLPCLHSRAASPSSPALPLSSSAASSHEADHDPTDAWAFPDPTDVPASPDPTDAAAASSSSARSVKNSTHRPLLTWTALDSSVSTCFCSVLARSVANDDTF
ncbi:hypothetical protein PR202_gb15142 [Eleusine coracana subsp. coracana]|uniref:Uncharacterized protein n=1 Tax=Eleusine coracana subsp. coracana TaxID=191504 RepID=A0AAV5EX71_ELECO|nr:hypothetical protein PR202_gb15142 [Eleusine coracana subsp. coracana]